MSFDNGNVYDIEELVDMSKEIVHMLELDGRQDLIHLFHKLLEHCDLLYETESDQSSEDYDEVKDVVEETIGGI